MLALKIVKYSILFKETQFYVEYQIMLYFQKLHRS